MAIVAGQVLMSRKPTPTISTSELDLLNDEDIDAMASKVDVLEEFVRQQQEQMAAVQEIIEQNLKFDKTESSIDESKFSLNHDEFTFKPRRIEEVKNRQNLETRFEQMSPPQPSSRSPITEYKAVDPHVAASSRPPPVFTAPPPPPVIPSTTSVSATTAANVTPQISKEEQLRRKIIENLDDAFELANKVDEIEIVIQERTGNDLPDDLYGSNEPLIEEIDVDEMGYDQFEDGDFDDDDWEDEYSGSDEMDPHEADDEVEGGVSDEVEDVSDVDDTDLMKRLEAKYGKLEWLQVNQVMRLVWFL